jgi:hypothetical protein
MSDGKAPVQIDLDPGILVRRSEKAFCIRCTDNRGVEEDKWIPLSQVLSIETDSGETDLTAIDIDNTEKILKIELPEWLAKKHDFT